MNTIIEGIRVHFAKVAAIVVPLLTIAATALANAAMSLGTTTPAGHLVGEASAGLTAGVAGITYMWHRFNWQALEAFGPGILAAVRAGAHVASEPPAVTKP